jgi:hypothetical protein
MTWKMPDANRLQDVLYRAAAPSEPMRLPSESEKREVERVHGLNIRTNAANLATALVKERGNSMSDWLAAARVIENYIRDGSG